MEDNLGTRGARMPENERKYESMLRPLSLRDFSRQAKMVENLKMFVMAACMRKETLDHVLLHGSPGLGETTLSGIIANELGVGFKVALGPVLDKPGDPAGVLTLLEKGDVPSVDEIRRLSPIVEKYLYPAMEDYRIDIAIDKGPSTRSTQTDSAPFTLIDAMTRNGLLASPLHARFGINMHLEYYDMETLTEIMFRGANILNVKCELNAVGEITSRSRGTPRIANALLRRVCDFAQVKGNGDIDKAIACFSLGTLDIGRYGLDQIDSKLLTTITDKFQGGPAGLTTITTASGENLGTLEEVYESFLIKEGFIKRTPRGREVTDLTYAHLGRSRVGEQGSLSDWTGGYGRGNETAR